MVEKDGGMTRTEIITRLKLLHDEMLEVGTAMDYFGGFESDVAKHGRELVGASFVIESWVIGMEEIRRCDKCGGEMKPGKAIAQTWTGTPDFHGDKHCVTVSPGGPGKLVDCMKCVNCGWSVGL